MSAATRVGEYEIRVSTSRGKTRHLVHYGQIDYAIPASVCGLESASWRTTTRDLPLCKKCALHAEYRGVAAVDLYPTTADR